MLRHDRRGFTMVELMVTITVMGILFGLSVPPVLGLLRSSRLTGASNTLVGDLRYGRALASSQASMYQIRFSANSYTLVRVSPYAVALTRALPRGIGCTASDTASFYAWGLTDPIVITMSSTGSSKCDTIRILANGNVTRD